MRNKIVLAITGVLCFILQCTLMKKLAIGSIAPNLLIIFVISTGLMRGEKYGMFVGFFLGLLEDLMFGTYPGMKALLYLITGYVSGYTNKFYYDNNMKVPMALVAVCDLLYNFGIYVFEFLLLGKTDFFYYLRRIIIPEVIYTVFFTIIVYRIFYHINYKLMKKDKKEGDSNWLLK